MLACWLTFITFTSRLYMGHGETPYMKPSSPLIRIPYNPIWSSYYQIPHPSPSRPSPCRPVKSRIWSSGQVQEDFITCAKVNSMDSRAIWLFLRISVGVHRSSSIANVVPYRFVKRDRDDETRKSMKRTRYTFTMTPRLRSLKFRRY